MESPDVAIAYDAGLDSNDVQDFVDDLVGKLGEYFTIGGCLDEMRLGLYKVSHNENSTQQQYAVFTSIFGI